MPFPFAYPCAIPCNPPHPRLVKSLEKVTQSRDGYERAREKDPTAFVFLFFCRRPPGSQLTYTYRQTPSNPTGPLCLSEPLYFLDPRGCNSSNLAIRRDITYRWQHHEFLARFLNLPWTKLSRSSLSFFFYFLTSRRKSLSSCNKSLLKLEIFENHFIFVLAGFLLCFV